MGKVVKTIVGIGAAVVGAVTGNWALVFAGVSMVGGALLAPKLKGQPRAAAATSVQIGEVPREAIVGRAATAGSLVDAFNYGGKYGTDWEVLVLALADNRCDALEGFYVGDKYVPFAGDGAVAGYNGQLSVWWRPGTENQTVPAVLTANGPGWTANDNGAGVCWVTVAYKADAADAKEPVWPGGRPRFLWVLRGALCYDPRKDGSVGGSGAHRWADPATRQWSENVIVARYNWARGFYACDRVDDPSMLLVGRGLSEIEAPPANLFARANLCDETVDGEPRYRAGGAIKSTEAYIDVEEDFAAACAGTIVQPEGCVEIDPGEARAVVATFTDDDLIVGSRARWNRAMLSIASEEWVNTIVASYIEPTQKWAEHGAPVRRETADIVADGKPREQRMMLGFVTWVKQAGRVAEVARRFGRLRGRAEVTLPPRFAFIEEGDWVGWQSDRRFGGATMTFRVESWGSNEAWHHSLRLRQISASVFSATDPLDDGSIAAQQPAPPAIAAPAPGSWALEAGYLDGGGIRTPALFVTGAQDDPAARFVRMEFVLGDEVPGPATLWTDAGITGPDIQRREIAIAAGGIYHAAVSYVVDGVQGARLILGPVACGAATYPDGTPIEDLKPAEPGATDGATVGENVRDSEGVVIDPTDLLNASLRLTDDGELQIVRAAFNEALGSIRVDALGAASAGAMRNAGDALDRLAAVVTQIDTRLAGTQAVIRDAGIYVDPENGKVTISAIDATNERIGEVSFTLDAVAAQIALKASVSYVDEAIATAVIDPSQVPIFDDITARLTSAEVRLDGAEASLLLKADAATVDALSATLTAATLDIDALQGTVAAKVDSVTFDALETRVASAEDTLSALGDVASIERGISVARMVARRQEDDAAATLGSILAGDAAQRGTVAALAAAREEITTRLLEGDGAEARAREALAVRVASTEAAATTETLARVQGDTALGGRIDSVEAGLADEATARAAAVTDEQFARITADTALGGRVDTVEASIADEVNARSAAVSAEQQARIDADGAIAGTVENISTAVNGHTASIQSFGESIDGLSVRYGWKLNAGGKAIGWVANNDGTEGGLDFVVDYFRLWKADGTASRAPFEFRNGDIFIANAAIENLSVGTIKIAGNAITYPVHLQGASVGLASTAAETTMVESAWLAPGTVETPASCLIGFYATVRTSGLAGFGPDAAVDFKLYADQGSGYALIGAQSVGINVTGGSAYFWLPISVIDLVTDCVNIRIKVTAKAVSGPQGEAVTGINIGAPTLVIQASKR